MINRGCVGWSAPACGNVAAVHVTWAYAGAKQFPRAAFWCWDCWGQAWTFFEPLCAAKGMSIWTERWLGMGAGEQE